MLKAYKYRINPSRKQETLLEQTLGICCELYNAALQERRDAYRTAGKSINYLQQANQLPAIKQTREDLKTVHSQVLQDALKRLDKAMEAFFRRVKAGEKPGYPRFRSRARYDSITYPQGGYALKTASSFFPRSAISRSSCIDRLKERSRPVLSEELQRANGMLAFRQKSMQNLCRLRLKRSALMPA